MKFLGGKQRFAKEFAQIFSKYIKENKLTVYYEPFIGGCGIISSMKGLVENRYGSRFNPYLVKMWQDFQSDHWLPPKYVSEEMYYDVKTNPQDYESATIAFVSIACSWGSKEWGGYARSKENRNYALESFNNLMKMKPSLNGIHFFQADYREHKFNNCLYYLDPPYESTTGYYKNKFDHKIFWEYAAELSKKSIVLVSSYVAPDGWKCIWSKNTKVQIGHNNKSMDLGRVEKLFKFEG